MGVISLILFLGAFLLILLGDRTMSWLLIIAGVVTMIASFRHKS